MLKNYLLTYIIVYKNEKKKKHVFSNVNSYNTCTLSNKAMQLYLIGTITESFSSNINDSCLSLWNLHRVPVFSPRNSRPEDRSRKNIKNDLTFSFLILATVDIEWTSIENHLSHKKLNYLVFYLKIGSF